MTTIAWLSADRYKARVPGRALATCWRWGASVALNDPYVTTWIPGFAAGRAWAEEQGAK